MNGSFLENIEVIEDRFPGDLDFVTFYTMPKTTSQQSLLGHLRTLGKADIYVVQLDDPDYVGNVRLITYWYSMWAHRRNGLWKGFLQVDLDSTSDKEARTILNAKKEVLQ